MGSHWTRVGPTPRDWGPRKETHTRRTPCDNGAETGEACLKDSHLQGLPASTRSQQRGMGQMLQPPEGTTRWTPMSGASTHWEHYRTLQTYFLPTLSPGKMPSPGRDRLQKGLADSLSGVVHAVPGAQLGRGVVEPQLCLRDLDLTQFLQHLCALGWDTGVSDRWQRHEPLVKGK